MQRGRKDSSGAAGRQELWEILALSPTEPQPVLQSSSPWTQLPRLSALSGSTDFTMTLHFYSFHDASQAIKAWLQCSIRRDPHQLLRVLASVGLRVGLLLPLLCAPHSISVLALPSCPTGNNDRHESRNGEIPDLVPENFKPMEMKDISDAISLA